MRFRFVIGISIIIFISTMGLGLYNKASYKDFNNEEKPLSNFVVSLIEEELLDVQIELMEKELDSSKIIIAAKCEGAFKFRFSCTSQKITVEHVFKGEGLKKGDSIEIIRGSSCIFMSKEMYIDGRPSINMGFANEMISGNTYLVFLDRKLQTYDKNTIIYMQSSEFILAPIFSYKKIDNTPRNSIDEFGNFERYESVESNEFFLMTKESNEKINKFKEGLLLKYSY